jgi:hypothetical protein
MADVTHMRIEDLDAIEGFFEGFKFHGVRSGLHAVNQPPNGRSYTYTVHK